MGYLWLCFVGWSLRTSYPRFEPEHNMSSWYVIICDTILCDIICDHGKLANSTSNSSLARHEPGKPWPCAASTSSNDMWWSRSGGPRGWRGNESCEPNYVVRHIGDHHFKGWTAGNISAKKPRSFWRISPSRWIVSPADPYQSIPKFVQNQVDHDSSVLTSRSICRKMMFIESNKQLADRHFI